jgi:hypothetical protein
LSFAEINFRQIFTGVGLGQGVLGISISSKTFYKVAGIKFKFNLEKSGGNIVKTLAVGGTMPRAPSSKGALQDCLTEKKNLSCVSAV